MRLIALVAVCSVALTGCGALFVGTTQTVGINSSPVKSKVEVDKGVYTTPTSVELARNKSYTVTISKEGYETRSVKVNRQVSGAIVILDILGGIVPLVIDMAMGTWYKLTPDTVNVTLSSKQTGNQDIPVNLSAIDRGQLKINSSEPVTVKIETLE